MPLLEVTLIAFVVIVGKVSGDGFARTVESYDAIVHGEEAGSRYMSCPITNRAHGPSDQELIQSWDDQFQAMRYNAAIIPPRPTLKTMVTSLAAEVL